MMQFGLLCCAKNPCTYAGLLGFWPICGMGTFNSLATINNCTPDPTSGGNPTGMDDIWPNVYRTLTCSWVSDRGQWQTMVYQYQDYCDAPILVTTTSSDNWRPPYAYTGTCTVTKTSVSQSYVYPPGGGWGDLGGTGVLTCTLSNQIFGADIWADRTAKALALIMTDPVTPRFPIGTPNAYMETQSYFPVSPTYYDPVATGIGGGMLDAGYVCAATMGMPTRDPGWPPGFGFRSVIPFLPAIYDYDDPGGGISANFGGLICMASTWVLTGIAPNVIFTPATNHKTIYGQDFDPASLTMSPILQFKPTFVTTKTGLSHPDPLTLLPLTLTFLPADVVANFAPINGALYGILGFQSSWVAGTDGNGNPFPASPPVSIGAFPASGGAGGTGPGAGGGAPPM